MRKSMLPPFGHLAQLEEHPLDVRKVEGSSPPVSTTCRSKLCIACSDFFQKSERTHAAAPPFQTANQRKRLRFEETGTFFL